MPAVLTSEIPAGNELLALYDAVGWSAYTADPERLVRAMHGSHLVLCARDAGTGELVGLVRTVSDGQTIVYVQDILVAPDHQREGIGGALLDALLEHYADVRQLVLLTDDEPGQRAFYESRGLTEAHDMAPHPLRAFVRFV